MKVELVWYNGIWDAIITQIIQKFFQTIYNQAKWIELNSTNS